MREPNPAEIRVLKALRQVGAITVEQRDAAIVLLTETEPCPKCGGDGVERLGGVDVFCPPCEGTGKRRVIR